MYVPRRVRALRPSSGGPVRRAATFVAILLAGCAYPQRIELEPTGPGYERTRWRTIAVFASGDDVQRGYERLGLIRVEAPRERPTPSTVDRIRKRASEIGANAIILEEVGATEAEVAAADADGATGPGWHGVATAIRIPGIRWGDRYWRYAPAPDPLTEPSAPGEEAVGWKRLRSWRGNGDQDTESFAIPAGEWRVQWDAATPEKGNLEILVFRLPGQVLMARIGQDGGGAGSYLGLSGGGTYFLRVHGEGVAWEVAVDTWAPGGS